MRRFIFEHYRDGKLIGTYTAKNQVTKEGAEQNLHRLCRVNSLNGQPVFVPSWAYFGLIASGSVTLTSTLAVPGFTEVATPPFRETTQQVDAVAVVSGRVLGKRESETTFGKFFFSADRTVVGAFMTNVSSGSAGFLFGGASLPAPINFSAGDTLVVTYEVTLEVSDSVGSP